MIIKESNNFQLTRVCYRNFSIRYYVQCKLKDCKPRGKRISKKDADYLQTLNSREFAGACVIDFGVGLWSKRNNT